MIKNTKSWEPIFLKKLWSILMNAAIGYDIYE